VEGFGGAVSGGGDASAWHRCAGVIPRASSASPVPSRVILSGISLKTATVRPLPWRVIAASLAPVGSKFGSSAGVGHVIVGL
jgi:hypothetical protein